MPFLVLLFAHLVADYPLQGQFLSDMKGKNTLLLASHAGIWTGTIAVAAHLLGRRIRIRDVALLFVVHALADRAKAQRRGVYTNLDPLGAGLTIDQSIHMGQIAVLLATAKERN